jgi:hypothetical protein
MIVKDVMQEIADRVDTIDGLRVHAYPAATIVPPAAVVAYPDSYDFDGTYGRGMDSMSLSVVVWVGKALERTTRDRISAYLDGSGTSSLKEVLESDDTYSSFDVLRVVSAKLDVFTMNGADYLVAVFDLDISGQGS